MVAGGSRTEMWAEMWAWPSATSDVRPASGHHLLVPGSSRGPRCHFNWAHPMLLHGNTNTSIIEKLVDWCISSVCSVAD